MTGLQHDICTDDIFHDVEGVGIAYYLLFVCHRTFRGCSHSVLHDCKIYCPKYVYDNARTLRVRKMCESHANWHCYNIL
jgi:hypothetical protein